MLSIGTIAAKVFGSANDRKLRVYRPNVEAINELEPQLERLTDAELRARTQAFRKELAEGSTLNDLLVPAFATVREASKRTLGQRHFDVQLVGGMVLHEGKIAEMKTGEGKTLVATLPVYLNALAGRGVHVVTVNDYLAKRDAEWMGRIYKFLGLTVGCIVHELDDDQRRAQYACDVTYGTNNELGFDYLRDNMKMSAPEMVQRGHVYAIVDEVDSILIDEARTPLIISGPVEDRAELYNAIDALIPLLAKEDFEVDEKQRQASFTEVGNEHMEDMLREREVLKSGSLYDIENVSIVHHASQGLKAHKLFLRDRDYIVKANQVIIIDEFTGRMMQGRRYSDGLHQALEAKEKVEIQPENQTLASITFQNYFRLYQKLAGMTGTALTEANEFLDIYRLDVLEVPTNRKVDRTDEHDEVYRTMREKSRAIVAEIADCVRRGQPILVGTTSIEKSETLSALLKDRKYIKDLGTYLKGQADTLKAGKQDELKAQLHQVGDYLLELGRKNSSDPIPHLVLNARYHEQEAHIIAQAGIPGTVTIATNMAGRGTDIQLGGNDRYRGRDWVKEEIDAGRAGAVHFGEGSTEAVRQWMDDILTAADEWVDGRLGEWVGAKLEAWKGEQGAAGQEPSPKEIAKKRAAIEGERLTVAEKRAELAKEFAQAQSTQAAGRLNGEAGHAVEGWSDARLRAEAGEWSKAGEGALAGIGETLFRFMSERLDAWVAAETAQGRAPSAEETAARRAAIVATLRTFKRKGAEIQADVAEKKKKAIDAGGLYVLGTERHESRRIDNQLRGRSGRQGDPGRSKFYLSLEDDLMRIFGSDRMDGMLQKLGLQEGEAITHPWINKALEKAQQKVEARNFDSRKYVLKYDDVMNDQRKVIFEQRVDIMGHDDVSETVTDLRHQAVNELVAACIPPNAYVEQWNTTLLKDEVKRIFGLDLPIDGWAAEEGIADQEITERLIKTVDEKAGATEAEIGRSILDKYESAKALVAFIDNESGLGRVLKESGEDFEAVGRALLTTNPGMVRFNGGTPPQAVHAAQIGYQFYRQQAEARGIITDIDGAGDKSPAAVGALQVRKIEKLVLLQTLDHLWREHLVTLEHLRQVIGFRSYGQRDPLNEYKSEGFHLFEAMLSALREQVTHHIMHLQAMPPAEEEAAIAEALPPMQAHHVDPFTGEDELAMAEAALAAADAPAQGRPSPRRAPVQTRKTAGARDPKNPATWGKVARNAPCPCGSGKKYKHCHGKHD